MRSKKKVSRRGFLSVAAAAGAAATMGCPRRRNLGNGVKVYKRSGRGIHVSNAAKLHNANKLFRTASAAQSGRAHPGDNSYVVDLIINKDTFDKLFAGGKQIADLRHDL
ncbi:MAG: twin-arginine translocation signal domain-containing protein [Candidatus Hydrogenedentes bacterium]|nr:twin-arginine translocation signal domain-containing protein [Candidatus Hydrogenedentota bacterium]